MRRFTRWLIVMLVIGSFILALSGSLTDPWIWAYIGAVAGLSLFGVASIDEDLARERFTPPAASADRTWLLGIRLTGVAHLVVGALDSGRFHWTTVPAWLRIIGLVGFSLGYVFFIRAMVANRYFSAVVRVQVDRGHHVVDTGPYRAIRHPGYAALIPAVPFSGLALGSWVSVAIGIVFSGLILRRVAFEDRFLHANLPGYAEYATRVRYRLVPGVW